MRAPMFVLSILFNFDRIALYKSFQWNLMNFFHSFSFSFLIWYFSLHFRGRCRRRRHYCRCCWIENWFICGRNEKKGKTERTSFTVNTENSTNWSLNFINKWNEHCYFPLIAVVKIVNSQSVRKAFKPIQTLANWTDESNVAKLIWYFYFIFFVVN